MLTLRQRLDKCKASLEAHIARGGTRSSRRGMELELRYDQLRLDAFQTKEWPEYCAAYDLDVAHRGWDFFA